MALHPGDHIAHYELTSLLGAGGMGEVYRATDTRLRREVAIKVLPDGLAHDRDRLERFQREATILASLNHPHIAQVYGLEQVRDSVALVMELIEGDELSRRIGRISIAEAIGIAAQIASALDAAHAAGVIHRDLKPANVMIRDDGSVRILDFGLAKVEHSAASPTITDAGTVLGTIAYMAPEQARGKAVDKRSDIWAFGCVLFEMLAGTRAFPGESASDTVAGVLEREPDWSALPASVPPSLGVLLRKCLQKDRANRLRDIGDALFDLAQAQLPPSAGPESRAAPSSRAREYAAWAIAAAAVIGLIVMATSEFRSDDQAPPVVRFAVQPPQGRSFGPMAVPHAALSPSGTHLAFVSNTDGSEPTLWVRALDDPEPRELPGTRGAANPFWSPDGQSLAFVAAGRLLRTDLSGAGTPQMIAKLPLGLEGGDWSESNSILFGTGSAGIFRVPAGGGEPIVVTTRQVGEPSHHWPSWLPGDRFLYRAANGQVFVASLAGTDARPLLKSDAKVAFVPPATLLFVRGEELMAQTFHPDRGVLEGSPRRVIEQLRLGNVGRAGFSASRTNALMYVHRAVGLSVATHLLDGQARPIRQLPLGQIRTFALSPNGASLAVHAHETNSSNGELWIVDVNRGSLSRIDDGTTHDDFPVWSPDGRRLAVTSGGLAVLTVGANPKREQLITGPAVIQLSDWSSDGKWLVYSQLDPDRGFDIWALPLSGDRKPFPLIQTTRDERGGILSPDVKWLAYTSSESGRPEVYVQAFPPDGRKIAVSVNGASSARWQDARTLYYWGLDGRVMRVRFTKGDAMVPETAVPVFNASPISTTYNAQSGRTPYDLLPGGRGFVVVRAVQTAEEPLLLVLNWQAQTGAAQEK